MLQASELTNLNDNDVDLKNLILRVRDGKGGKDAPNIKVNENIGED
jgi:hypothetical protein